MFFCRYDNSERNLHADVWKITETIEELSSLVADEEQLTYANEAFCGEKRRREWLATRLLARRMFGENISIEYESSGRPYINAKGFISISHTNDYVAVAYSCDIPVGVDIERRDRDMSRSAARFVDEEELDAMDAVRRNDSLLLHWSVKEAVYKITGNLGGSFRDNIKIAPFRLENRGVLNVFLQGVDFVYENFTVEYFFEQDFVIVLCYPLINE